MANGRALLSKIVALLALLFLISAGSPVFADEAPERGAPAIVYVADFELDKSETDANQGPLPRPFGREGVLGRLRSGRSEDPQEIIDLMATQLVQDLAGHGMGASRLGPAEPFPQEGWLVRGVFVNVDQGNRLRRAVIGFGAGQTNLEVVVLVSNLRQGVPQPMYQVESEKESNKMPGAAITLNPYVAAAKFLLAGQDLDKSIRHAASDIADAVVRDVRP
jgi:hypothetical protein